MKLLTELIKEHFNKCHLVEIEFMTDLLEELKYIDATPHGKIRMTGGVDPRYHNSVTNEGGITSKMIENLFKKKLDDILLDYIHKNKVNFGKGPGHDSFGLVVDDTDDMSWYIIFNIFAYNENDDTYKILVYDAVRHNQFHDSPTYIKHVKFGMYVEKNGYVKTEKNIKGEPWPQSSTKRKYK